MWHQLRVSSASHETNLVPFPRVNGFNTEDVLNSNLGENDDPCGKDHAMLKNLSCAEGCGICVSSSGKWQ